MKTTTLTVFFALFCAVFPVSAQDSDTREGGLTGTGIVGIITKLGSFFVNNQRVTYAPDTSVQSVLGELPAGALVPGDTVATQVVRVGESWVARDIRQIHPIIGPISARSGDFLTIMGTKVDLTDVDTPDLNLGDWVAISGLWRENEIAASRVKVIPAQQQGTILGSFLDTSENASFMMGGSRVSGIAPRHATFGDVLQASGTPQPTGLEAKVIKLGLFDVDIGIVLVQGHLSQPTAAGQYTVLGGGLTSFTEQPEMIAPDQRVMSCGADGLILSKSMVQQTTLSDQLGILGCTRP